MATTKTDPKAAAVSERDVKKAGKTYEGLSREQLIEAYRLMYTSRRVDDREILLKRQQKIFFQISGAGHEAVGVAAAFALKAGYDWFYPLLSRSRALPRAGHDALRHAAAGGGRGRRSQLGRPPDAFALEPSRSSTSSPGRRRPERRFCRRSVARRPAATCCSSRRRREGHGDYRQFKDVMFHGDEVIYVSLGDGTTSEGEFWEALNTASNPSCRCCS